MHARDAPQTPPTHTSILTPPHTSHHSTRVLTSYSSDLTSRSLSNPAPPPSCPPASSTSLRSLQGGGGGVDFAGILFAQLRCSMSVCCRCLQPGLPGTLAPDSAMHRPATNCYITLVPATSTQALTAPQCPANETRTRPPGAATRNDAHAPEQQRLQLQLRALRLAQVRLQRRTPRTQRTRLALRPCVFSTTHVMV